jgi:peptidoglycan hydrolase-like protein with peptidoglycan-binding domain
MRRRTLAFVVLGAVLLSSLVTWFASSKIRSPAEIAAQAAPPVAAPILAPVEKRVLATKIVSRGTGHYGSARTISLTPSALKDGAQVVTTVPKPGARFAEGDVLLTVSGRPTFLLDGAQPAYRDLGPGMSGKDVRQLEKALRRLGLRPGSVDGYYDDATERAVTALYRKNRFRPVVATAEQLAAVQSMESTLVRGARARGGTQFPSDELVFLPATPVQVVKVTAKPGSEPKGPVLTVSNSVVSVDGALPVEQAGLIKTGAVVLVDEPALAIKAEGTISRIAKQPGTDGADGFHVAFSVTVPEPPPALVGASVRLTVPIKSTKKSTLVVPVGALSLGADGASRVQRSVGGVISPVRVEPGLSAEGYVAVTALDGKLAPGDLVVVGFNE